MRILVIQTAFIGDVVLATALLEKLHDHHPEARIDVVVRAGNEALLTGHPFVGEVLVWEKRNSKYGHLIALIRRIRLNKYDTVINVQRFAATGLMTALSGAGETVGFEANPLSIFFSKRIPHSFGAIHETSRNQRLIAHLTDTEPAKPRLYPSQKNFHQAGELAGNEHYISIAPASVWFTKQYPAGDWVRFIQALPESLSVVLIGAPGDQRLCEEIASSAGRSVKNLAGKLGFLASAALQSRALMNFVNDSAPLHFASAMNAPVTAVYCSTLPSFGYGPLSDDRAIVALESELACRPCGLHGRSACPEGHFNCARLIRTEQLLARVPVV